MEKLIKTDLGQWTLIKGDEISAPKLLPKWTRPESEVYPIKSTAQMDRVARVHQNATKVIKRINAGRAQPKKIGKHKLKEKIQDLVHSARGVTITNDTGVVNMPNVGGDSVGTTKHEALHVLVNRVHNKYGKDAAIKLTQHLFDSMHPEHRDLMMDYVKLAHPSASKHELREEAIAHTISARNSKSSRDSFMDTHKDNLTRHELDRGLKASYKAMVKRLRTLEPYEILGE